MSQSATKRWTVFPREATKKNDTVKSPSVPQAATETPPTSSSSALAGADNAAVVADPSSSVASSIAVDPSKSTIPSSAPASVPQAQPTTSSPPPAATSIIPPSVEVTPSPALPDSPTSSTQQLPTVASFTLDGEVASSSPIPSSLEPSSAPAIQPAAVTSSNPSTPAVAVTVPTSSFQTLPSLSSASTTTIQTTNPLTPISDVTTTPSAIPPSAAAGQSTATPPAAAGANSSAPPNSIVGVVMGGVVGGLALAGILLFFCWRYHRKRGSRHSSLTPLNAQFNRFQSEKYEIDGSSLGPTGRGTRWKAQAGGMCSRAQVSIGNLVSSVKAKLGGRDNAPTINMDRGNSQFLEQSPQHSRSGSATSLGAADVLVHGECFRDRWNRFTQKIIFNWRLHTGAGKPTGRSVTTGIRTKKGLRQDQVHPEFPRLLASRDGEPRVGLSGHRRSLSTAGLDFTPFNPFPDLYPSAQPTIPDLTRPPIALTPSPFQSVLDPASFSSPKPNSSNYLVNVQRSRGLSQPGATSSVSGTRPPGGNTTNVNPSPVYPLIASAAQPTSRYPSMISTSLDSNRDTVLSGYSASGRKMKGRSDPFDLQCPEFLRPAMPIVPDGQPNNMGLSPLPRSSTGSASQVRVQVPPRFESIPTSRTRTLSATDSFASSKYSSGTSALLNEWGDSGLDLGGFAWERATPIPPQDHRVSPNLAQGGEMGDESTEGVVGRAL